MNKYYESSFYSSNYSDGTGVESQLMADESIVWKGTPKKTAFVLNASGKMMPFALLWLFFDGFMIFSICMTGELKEMAWFIIPFFAIHLLPVWIWLYNTFTAFGRWKNTEYAITNKRILIRNGFIGFQFESIYFSDISNVSMHVGTVDKLLGVGDIHFITANHMGSGTIAILDVEDYGNVYALAQNEVAANRDTYISQM